MLRLFSLILLGYWGVSPAAAGSLLDDAQAGDDAPGARSPDTGAVVRGRGSQGDTPLHWAAFLGQETVVAQLIAAGADVNAAVNNGNTPLHQAAYRGNKGVVELLIAHGAEVNRRTRSGVTPLGWAKRNGHQTVAQILIAHGARKGVTPDAGGTSGRRPTDVSVRRTGPLPDAVVFAALGSLASVHDISIDSSDLSQPVLPITKRKEQLRQASRFRVQLVAMRSEARAREMWQLYLARYPEVLDNLQLNVEPARVNGVSFYRVQAGPLTKIEARTACAELGRAQQACLVVSVSDAMER